MRKQSPVRPPGRHPAAACLCCRHTQEGYIYICIYINREEESNGPEENKTSKKKSQNGRGYISHHITSPRNATERTDTQERAKQVFVCTLSVAACRICTMVVLCCAVRHGDTNQASHSGNGSVLVQNYSTIAAEGTVMYRTCSPPGRV